MKNNPFNSKIQWLYLAGFFIILLLPVITAPPWFFPADFGKTIIFRSIVSILGFLFIWQLLFKKNDIQPGSIKKNTGVWLLGSLFSVFLLATIFSVDPYFSLWGSPERSGGFINFAYYIAFAILAFFIFKKEDWKKVWDIAIIGGILVALVAVIQFFGLFSHIFLPVISRPPSTLGNPIFLGIYLLLLCFLTLSKSIEETNRKKKIFYIGSFTLFLFGILLTESIAAYLGLFIGIMYFALLYPKKMPKLKLAGIAFLVAGILLVFYANQHPKLPGLLEKIKPLNVAYSRLASVNTSFKDAYARFYAWEISFNAFKQKPLLGYGPENFEAGFDKHYDPSLPYINDISSDWWDRGHNIVVDMGMQAGILGILAYFALLGFIFFKLQKAKVASQSTVKLHALQTTLIAYVVANMFSFDSFSSYLIYFLLIGYCLYVIYGHSEAIQTTQSTLYRVAIKNKYLIISCLGILLAIFLWQYNINPLQINKTINIASRAADIQQCDSAVATIESIMPKNSFLYVYSRAKYIGIMKNCEIYQPEKNLAFTERGIEIMKEAALVRPLYSRLWIFLGAFTAIKASGQQDANQKNALIDEANSYFKKAFELAGAHQELILEQARTYMIAGNYDQMKKESENCIALYPHQGNCWWMRALSEIYLNQPVLAEQDTQSAKNMSFDTTSVTSLNQLATAYAKIKNYQKLALVYEQLIRDRSYYVPQYHSSLAFTYSQLGQYKKARQEALIFLQLMPEAKNEVDAFLKSLPQ